ncbi:MFS transporter [Amycolatopsis orientalis]|uniref:MFS transporter n=1 Tax=Amycolatopsis orientalis TaxID=31958 RepID=UPI00039F51A2|nr:MFS transporter [Amycolatopsis orientalis]
MSGPAPHQPAPHRARHRSVADALDAFPLTRAQFWVMGLVMAGMFFDTLQQDAPGAIGPMLKEALGIGNDELVTINTLTVVGGIVGRLVGGYLADRKGRRFSLSFNLLVYTIGGLLSAFAPNYPIMLISRFIVGIGLGGEFTIGLTLVSEIVATKRRGTAVGSMGFASGGIGNFAAYGLFVVVLGPLNNVLGGNLLSWRWLLGFLAIPALLVVVYRRYLPESPRFLVDSGRIHEANRALTILASDNIRKRPSDAEVVPFLDTSSSAEVQPHVSPTEIFKRPLLKRTVAISVASWMAFGAQVTLLVLLPTLLVSKGYSVSSSLVFTLIMYAGSMFGALAAALVAAKLPRRTTVLIAGVLGCLSAIAFAELANGPAAILIYGSVFQFFSLFLNSTLALWSPELYPTRVRALGCSTVNGVGNIAGALMPFAAVFAFDHAGVAGVFLMIAAMYTILAVSARFAPETLGRSLEDINEQQETAPAAAPAPEANTA